MKNKQPTEAQVKEFWEWCGFEEIHHKGYWNNLYWKAPIDGWEYPIRPCIDLNNLFKHAVPKLENPLIILHLQEGTWLCQVYHAKIEGKPYTIGVYEDKDPALALFWAIYEAIKEC